MVLSSTPKRPASIHHKKRTGQHHKRGKQYTKTYWPYLPLLLIVGLGFAVNGVWGAKQKNVLGYATSVRVSQLLADTNQERNLHGQRPLRLNNQLVAAAQRKATDMAAHNYWSHIKPDGTLPWSFITQAGYNYREAGENLAYGFATSEATVTGWMNSPEHRANMLNDFYKDVGFGIVSAPNFQSSGPETIVVAMYALPAPAGVPAPQVSTAISTADTSKTPKPLPSTASSPAPSSPHSIARVQLLAGDKASWSAAVLATLTMLCALALLVKHGLLWHRVLRRGEEFIVRYHALDIVLVIIGVAGFILTRSAGIIH